MAKTINYDWDLPSPGGLQLGEIAKIATTFTAIDVKIKSFETALSTHKHAFAELTNKPTTLGGFGITDGMTADEVALAIKSAVDNLVNGSGEALDTLKELADALGNDPNFAASVGTALGVRVRVDAATNFSLAQRAQGRSNIDALGTVDRGAAGGVASLDSGGKVPSAQLPALTTTATVGAAVAGANGKTTPADGDFFAGIEAGGSTMFKTTWANIKSFFINKSGDALTGSLKGVSVAGSRASFYADAQGGAYAQMYERGAPFQATAPVSGSAYAPIWTGRYNNGGWAGVWSGGIINYDNGSAAGLVIHHINSGGTQSITFEYRADGTLRLPGAVYKGGSSAAYADGGTYWMHITGNAGSVGGWTLDGIRNEMNWRVSDTRFAGYLQNGMFTTGTRTSGLGGSSGYVMTDIIKNAVESCDRVYRQPQIYIPNVGWRALGAW
ncbi:hypothetical protein ABE530_18260 [Brucella sp. TWI559]